MMQLMLQIPGLTLLMAALSSYLNSFLLSRLGEQLGSAQFGTVYQGELISAAGERLEVAVKTLKEGSGEQDRVKFLQEAAIMGQFKHLNVVNMYGVVTDGEPVSYNLHTFTTYCCGWPKNFTIN